MNKRFYALLISQTSTNLGFSLYTMAVVMTIFKETGSTTLSALVTILSLASRLISAFLLPSISDKFALRSILIFAQSIQLPFIIVLAVLLVQEYTMPIMLLLFSTLTVVSFFNGWFGPIKSTLVRSAVAEDNRVRANSLLATVDQTFLLAGWSIGGILLQFVGLYVTLGLTFLLILLSLCSLATINIQAVMNDTKREPFVVRITEGWKYLFKHQGLRVIVTMDLIEAWVGTIWLGPITIAYAYEVLNKGEAWWGYINSGYYLGAIIGGILIYKLSTMMQGNLTIFMITGAFLFGMLTFTYGLITNAYLALLLVVLMGPAYQMRDMAQVTMTQNSADERTLTKVMAAKSTLIQFISIVSMLGISLFADWIGVKYVYIFAGILLISSALYGFIHLYILKKGVVLEKELEQPL
ncbi:MFS transporter [Cytobacillus sp. IB215316]|uniref:MFS transporter n=1 Tax=Cytobacillus sp. IB215316 TaxID=3097354 RepID=UPI002A14A1DA|nr:MFS transporter [Cytobacillus sp. IB215316]MDX8361960.1 MFS transporter [Cytobacillus sp. IB215316]